MLPLHSLFWKWRWTVLGLLLPLAILNELGHVIALLCFGGRNLGECLIPFVGVTEIRDWGGLTRWKRALVALADPALSIAGKYSSQPCRELVSPGIACFE